jgi:hypothetical protein
MPVSSRLTLARAGLVLAALIAATGLAVELRSSASAQGAATRTITFRELDKGATSTHVTNTKSTSKQANLQGDLIVFTNPVVDATGKRLGTLHASCTTTVGSRDFARSTMGCGGFIALHDGTLMVQVLVPVASASATGAVVGGTGAYANARGTFTTADGKNGKNDTVTLVG